MAAASVPGRSPARFGAGAQPGEYRVQGDLTFDTVGALLDDSLRQLRAAASAGGDGDGDSAASFAPTLAPRLTIDLAGVGRSDSAGVALLVEWLRRLDGPRGQGRVLRFINIPPQMRAIVQISDLDELLRIH